MTRDESSGGWVPLRGGGLANVSVRKRIISCGSSSSVTTTNGLNPQNTQVLSTALSNSQNHGSLPPILPKRPHEYLIYGKRISDQSVSKKKKIIY